MSALYNMISALVAMLIAFALAHFGASERFSGPAPASPTPASRPLKSDNAPASAPNAAQGTDQDQRASQ